MWLDKVAAMNFVRLRDAFGIRRLIETGTAEGTNAIYYARHFEEVHTCEINMELSKRARARALNYKNVWVTPLKSPHFLRRVRGRYEKGIWDDVPLFFLDAHTPGSWPILEELEALEGFGDCCVVIHDFKVPDPEMGYLCYKGQALDLEYVREGLFDVNPDFVLYHNARAMSEVWTREEVERGDAGMPWDEATRWQIDYAWSSPVKTHRGILYAVPQEVEGLEVKRWTLG